MATLTALLTWLLLVTAVPAVLGLSTWVGRGHDHVTGLDSGTLVLAHGEPSDRVRAGDLVIVGPVDDRPVRRVTATAPGWLLTATADGVASPVAIVDHPTTRVVVATIPYVGMPLIALGALGRWLLVAAVGALLVMVLVTGRRTPSTRSSLTSETPRASLV